MEIDNKLNLEEAIVENFNFDNEEEEIDIFENQNNNIANEHIHYTYNNNIYNFSFVYSYMKENHILKSNIIFPACNEIMQVSKSKDYIDGIYLRCRKQNPKHDIKISIRKDSFIEKVRIDIVTIYFLLYECYLFNKSINNTYIEYDEFIKHINVKKITEKNISLFFQIIRNKIKQLMHKEWSNNKLGQFLQFRVFQELKLTKVK